MEETKQENRVPVKPEPPRQLNVRLFIVIVATVCILSLGIVGSEYILYKNKIQLLKSTGVKNTDDENYLNVDNSAGIQSPLFTKKISELDSNYSGLQYKSISLLPSNNYIIFSLEQKEFYPPAYANPHIGYYLGNIKNGSIQKIDGYLSAISQNNDIFLIASTSGLYLYDISSDDISIRKIFSFDNEPYGYNEYWDGGIFSPNNKWVIFNEKGINLLDLSTGNIRNFSNRETDKALLWFSNSEKILGVKAEGKDYETLGQFLAIYNIKDWTVATNLGIEDTSADVSMAKWIVPDKVAYEIFPGEDGSGEYSVDLDKKTVKYFSSSIFIDQDLGLMAGIDGGYLNSENSNLSMYNIKNYILNGKPFFEYQFQDTHRQGVAGIINNHQVIYLHYINSGKPDFKESTDVVLFDSVDKTEKILFHYISKTFPSHAQYYHPYLMLSKDRKMWILQTDDQLIARKL